MTPEAELKEIVSSLKKLILVNQEMGVGVPPISAGILADNQEKASGDIISSGPLSDLTSLESLAAHIGDCRRCKLYKGRTKLVFGEGLSRAKLVFVGEAPGREEDLEGIPFVGEAGKLLTKIIGAMGLTREQVYICNVLKCRPPGNRDPEGDEIEACIPFLKKQISIIKPEVICVLGRIAGQALLGGDFKITRDRGKWFSYMDIPLMPTYHPAYLTRSSGSRERELKGQVWNDMKIIMARLGLEVKKSV
ncbi:MAG TPA: uracil-DNA glycosylase [Desulfobacteraceae bacterium]|nr:uracil-DNA glycosylase [Desulfobacteraceae bacterium]HPJ68280.1 uracil-DNA glycosylase [Desulfobacteraceae bacterium]HPQ29224.1 uracil-DNA glycosylase [Desulfobacteraceae bacterium]